MKFREVLKKHIGKEIRVVTFISGEVVRGKLTIVGDDFLVIGKEKQDFIRFGGMSGFTLVQPE